MRVAVFAMFITLQEINIKRSRNATKPHDDFYGPEGRQWALVAPGGCPEGGTTHQGAPGPPGVPRWVVPTLVASCIASLLYKYPNIPETLGESTKIKSSAASSRNTRSNLDTITEGFIMPIGASPMMHE